MSGRNAKAVLVDSLFDPPGRAGGSFKYYERDGESHAGLHFWCPCGCGSLFGADFGPGGWTLEGPFEAPTVRPSLGCREPSGGFHWHGFLTAGEFKEC